MRAKPRDIEGPVHRHLPSADILRQLLRYEPVTGKLYWLPRDVQWFRDNPRTKAETTCKAWNANFACKDALSTPDGKGYLVGTLFLKRASAHRVIWAMVKGDQPAEVDHINGDRADNRLENLMASTRKENGKNTSTHVNNTSGYMGVRQNPTSRKWQAYIKVNRRQMHLGCFDRVEDAVAARDAAHKAHGFHQNHGRGT